MNKTKIPFTIGMQYENWEFDLEPLWKERVQGCDSYIYTRNISIEGIKPSKIELTFCLDILVAIVMEVSSTDIPKLQKELKGYYYINNYIFTCSFDIKKQLIPYLY